MPVTHRKPTHSPSIQSVLFEKDQWTVAKAKIWLKAHGYYYGKSDSTTSHIRFRQFDPSSKMRYRTITFGHGIKAVVAFDKKKR